MSVREHIESDESVTPDRRLSLTTIAGTPPKGFLPGREGAALEHEEESLIEQALGKSLDVARRPAASGWALLGIEPVPEGEAMAV